VRSDLRKLLDKYKIHDGLVREYIDKGMPNQAALFVETAIEERHVQIKVLEQIKEKLLAQTEPVG